MVHPDVHAPIAGSSRITSTVPLMLRPPLQIRDCDRELIGGVPQVRDVLEDVLMAVVFFLWAQEGQGG